MSLVESSRDVMGVRRFLDSVSSANPLLATLFQARSLVFSPAWLPAILENTNNALEDFQVQIRRPIRRIAGGRASR